MSKFNTLVLLTSLAVWLVGTDVRATPVAPQTDEVKPPVEDILSDPPLSGEEPTDTPAPPKEPGEGIIDLEEQEDTPPGDPDEVIYYTLGSPPESGEQPEDGDYIPLSAQSGVYHTPEPGSLALAGFGLFGLLGYGCRRRQA